MHSASKERKKNAFEHVRKVYFFRGDYFLIKPLFVLQEECEDMTLSFFHGKILTRIKGDWEKIVQFIEIIERKLSGNHLQGANSDEFKRA